ncbi:MAG: transporter [Nitrospinaceae bacterium]|nr:transporter [Nitrospinaceae bacterium]
MLKNKVVFFLSFIMLSWVSVAQAYIGLCCAHCGGNMPLNIFGGGIPEPKEFRFKLSQMIMEMGPLRDGTDEISNDDLIGSANGTNFPALPTNMQMYMTMIGAAYSFSDDFAVMGMTSYIENTMRMNLNNGNDFTMTSGGVGDVTLLAKYRAYADDNLVPTNQVSVLFGLSLPSGSINKKFSNHTNDTFNGSLLPFKMQLGSGTVDPIIGLTYQGSRDPFWWGFNTQLEGHIYDNEQGYRRAQELRYDFYAMKQVHDKVVVHAQLNGWYEGKFSDEAYDVRVLGAGHNALSTANNLISPLFDPDNYGGHKLHFGLGVQFQPLPLHVMELTASVPIHQDLNGPQLQDNWMVQFTYYAEVPTKKSRRYKGFSPPKSLGF